MVGDDAVHYSVEPRAGSTETREAGQRRMKIGLREWQRDEVVVEVHDDVDLMIDLEDVAGDVGIEKRAGDDFEGELHHLCADVDGLTGMPAGAA